jgi:hypothetical protein
VSEAGARLIFADANYFTKQLGERQAKIVS